MRILRPWTGPALLFGLLLFSPSIRAQDAFLADFQLKWLNAREYTLAFAQAMPEAAYEFRPVPEEMTFAEQLKHMAGNMIWLSSSYLNGKPDHIDPSKTGNSKREIMAMLEQAFDYAQGTLKALKPSELDQTVNFFAGTLSRRRVVMLMSDHLTHHRGQLVVYLRLRGVTPPKYKGW